MKDVKFPSPLFVTGIGTDVGKSYATGWLAAQLNKNGKTAITQKMIQTGNREWSEDIERHRKIMGIGLLPEDLSHITAPVIFSFPSSPHLAARLDGKEIDLEDISSASETLATRYDNLLIEGAGGLMVPIHDAYLTIDYIADHNLPVALVVTGQLGSINHALLSLSAIRTYGIQLFAIVYNPFFDKDATICNDTKEYLKNWIADKFPSAHWIEMPVIE